MSNNEVNNQIYWNTSMNIVECAGKDIIGQLL